MNEESKESESLRSKITENKNFASSSKTKQQNVK